MADSEDLKRLERIRASEARYDLERALLAMRTLWTRASPYRDALDELIALLQPSKEGSDHA